MKRIVLCGLAVIILVLVLGLPIVLQSCSLTKKQEYYSQKENYINAVGTLTHISYDKERNALYLAFSELTPTFDDNCFKIVGDNFLIVQENDIEIKIKIGEQVEFITAPRYFGDGYVMPIVEIAIGGEKLLEFEEGFTNLQKWIEAN